MNISKRLFSSPSSWRTPRSITNIKISAGLLKEKGKKKKMLMCRLCAVPYAVSCPGVGAQIRPRPRLSTRAVAGWPYRGFAPDSADPHRLIWRRMDGLVVWLSCPTVQPHTSTSLKAARPTIRTITKFFLFLFCYFHLAIVTVLKSISHPTDFTTVIIMYICITVQKKVYHMTVTL
jgi:hypothetical protein